MPPPPPPPSSKSLATWRRGTPAPETEMCGAAVVHGNTAYFCQDSSVYSYKLSQDKWTKLKQCEYESFSMAVVNGLLTTILIGGQRGCNVTNTLLSLTSSFLLLTKWEELLPPMPTPRILSASVTVPSYLIVAGGQTKFVHAVSVVEALNTSTLQWSSISSSPVALQYPNMTLCNGQLYLSEHSKIFSCSVKELLKSRKPASTNSSDNVWTELANIPVPY